VPVHARATAAGFHVCGCIALVHVRVARGPVLPKAVGSARRLIASVSPLVWVCFCSLHACSACGSVGVGTVWLQVLVLMGALLVRL